MKILKNSINMFHRASNGSRIMRNTIFRIEFYAVQRIKESGTKI